MSVSRLQARLAALRSARRGQGGFSLMEVLLVSAISAMIAIPVLAWMITAFKTQGTVMATSRRTQVTTQLTQVFPRDLSKSTAVLFTSTDGATPGVLAYDCSDADPADLVAASVVTGPGLTIAVYAAGIRDGETVVVRRTCVVDNPIIEEQVLGEPVRAEPAGLLVGSARLGGAYPAAEISGVDLVLNLPNARPVTISGARRTGVDP